jgi:AraC-like DNA-binding protein
MQRAAELLAAGGMTVREVANRVGYRQPAQFAKAFRRSQGVAPSGYRASGVRSARARLADPPVVGDERPSDPAPGRRFALAREAA